MRIRVDLNRCEGHTLCAMAAPTLIRLRDQDGRAEVVDRDLDEAEILLAQRAASSCPEQAISVTRY
jgi:ferredoxin